MLTSLAGSLQAHGVGGATDLPIPFTYAVVGASWALTISFAVLALAWKTPRYADDGLAQPTEPPRRPWLAALGLVVAAWFLGALFLGPDETANPGIGAFYVLVWVGLVPLALLAGHVWKDLSPWRSVQALVGRATGRPQGFATYPERLGHWPAALGLFAFVWLELAAPDAGSIVAVRTWVAAYVATTLVAGVVWGPRWFDRGDPFDVYSAVVARLSPFVTDRRPDLHDPLRTLPSLPVRPGLVTLLGILLGSTAFDSFSASATWQSRSPGTVGDTLGLMAFCATVTVLFVAAATATGGVDAERRRALPGLLAHSLVPIVVGYVLAHYLTYLLERGQGVVLGLLDPLGRGWQPLGEVGTTAFLSSQVTLLAVLKVGFVVAGHVLAVVAAHDRALVLLPRAHRLTGQLAMLLLMVGYTMAGLYLLFTL